MFCSVYNLFLIPELCLDDLILKEPDKYMLILIV